MQTKSNFRSALNRFLKFYGAFAVLHVLFKIIGPFLRRKRLKSLWKHIPGLEADFLAKRIRDTSKDFHDFYSSLVLENPEADIIKVDLPHPAIICNSPEAVRWMLKDQFKNCTKPGPESEIFALMREFLGKGVFVLRHGVSNKVENDVWFKQRKVASLIFTKSNFQNAFYDTFAEKSKIFVQKLQNEKGNEIDLQALFFSFTMDSIEKFFMGVDVDTISGGMSEYASAFDKAHSAMLKVMTKNLGTFVVVQDILPFPFGSLFYWTSFSHSLALKLKLKYFDKDYIEFQKNIKVLENHVYKYVKETRRDPKINERKDIIANFLNSKIGNELTDKQLRDIVVNLTLAGRDTTACALSWLFFQLTQNKEVQEKLYEELKTVLQGKIPTLEDLNGENLPYLNGVVYEALRLHPPVPTDYKVLEKEATYLDGTIFPARTECIFSPRGIGRNPARFKNPMKFDPDRWIPFEQPSLYEFPVFQAGPRFCLGKDMALFEMKLLTSVLVQKFRFEMDAEEADKVRYSLMLTQSISVNEDRNIMRLNVRFKERTLFN